MGQQLWSNTYVRSLVAGSAVVGVLTLAACSSADKGSGTSGPSGTTGGGTSSSYYSPLQEFLDPSASAGQTTSDEQYQAMEKQVQELIATCMTDQGFEYIPFTYPRSSDPGGQPILEGRSYVEKYGYGISTYDNSESMPSETFTDPNQAIVQAMSEAEQQAYNAALWGDNGGMIAYAGEGGMVLSGVASTMAVSTDSAGADPASTDPASTDPAGVSGSEAGEPGVSDPASIPIDSGPVDAPSFPSLAEQGCWGKAQAEIYGDTSKPTSEPTEDFQDMWDAFNKVYENINQDPRIAAAVQQWIGCMSDASYTGFTEMQDANTMVYDKWAELNGWPTQSEMEGMKDGGGMIAATSVAGTETPTSPPADKVAEFRTYEIAVALADFDCKQTAGYDGLYDQIRIELEKKFVEEHQDELQRYRDSMNGGG